MVLPGARDKYKLDKKIKIKVGHGGTLDPMAEGTQSFIYFPLH